ncbi:MAG TPA: serpin family protein [Polyangiaceae bacterium]|jgi:serpin B|nr:serpin family protein [Polyangiaceae bacterium]
MRSFVLHTVPFALLAAACSLDGQNFDVVQSNQPRDTAPTVSAADAAQLSKDDTQFAIDLFNQVAQDDSANVFYSPYSISLALAMTYNGANGNTAAQMAQALRFSLPVDRLNAALDAVDLALASRKNALDSNGNKVTGFQLNVADSLWADKTLVMQQPFVDTLGQSYGASVRLVDFVNAPDPSRLAINGWVSDQTNAKISELIGQGDIDSSTRLVLANAIYFNAAWETPFEATATHAEAFTHLDGTTVTENAMTQTLETSYAHGDGWQAVELPYVGEQTSMVLVVPDQGKFSNVEKGLSGDFVQSVFAGLSFSTVNVTMPKFSIKGATVHLKDTLEALGMKDAFDMNAADFSKMSTQPLYVGDVLHQAFVSVDEKGTEAAAATAVIMKAGAAPSDPVSLDANRPFFFLVRDVPTNTVLFLGRVVDPT